MYITVFIFVFFYSFNTIAPLISLTLFSTLYRLHHHSVDRVLIISFCVYSFISASCHGIIYLTTLLCDSFFSFFVSVPQHQFVELKVDKCSHISNRDRYLNLFTKLYSNEHKSIFGWCELGDFFKCNYECVSLALFAQFNNNATGNY